MKEHCRKVSPALFTARASGRKAAPIARAPLLRPRQHPALQGRTRFLSEHYAYSTPVNNQPPPSGLGGNGRVVFLQMLALSAAQGQSTAIDCRPPRGIRYSARIFPGETLMRFPRIAMSLFALAALFTLILQS